MGGSRALPRLQLTPATARRTRIIVAVQRRFFIYLYVAVLTPANSYAYYADIRTEDAMTKTQEISRQIIEKASSVAAANGLPCDSQFCVRAAFDHVLGEGAYDNLVSQVYDAARLHAVS